MTTQPATGTTPSTWRASARNPKPAPIVASTSGSRLWSTSTPCAAASRSTRRIWFSVSTAKSAPGTKTATPMIPFWRENRSISASHTGSRSTGSRAARRRGVLAEPAGDGRGDLVDRKARPGLAHDDVGREHVRDVEDLGAGLDGDDRNLRPLRRAELALVLLGRRAAEHAHEDGGVLDPAAGPDCARRGPARELLLELRGERAAHLQRPRVLRGDPQLLHEPPDRERAQLRGHQRARRRLNWPRA